MDPGFYYLGGFGNRGKGLFYIILWICLRYGLDSLWYFMVSYGIFRYVVTLYTAIWLCFEVLRQINVKIYVEYVLEIWFRYVVDTLLVCLRYGLDSLWYVIVSYGIFFLKK